MTFKTPQAVRYLKSHWKHLDALTKGSLVSKLTNSDVSRRALARELGCSESNLRHLEKLSTLPDAVKADIRDRKISVRAAIAQSNVVADTADSKSPVAIAPALKTTANPVAQLPLDYVAPPPTDAKGWASLIETFTLHQYSQQWDRCAQVVSGARLLSRGMPCLRLGTGPIPFGASTSDVIQNSRPVRRVDEFTDVCWWLAAWVLRLVPERKIRAEAFDIAERMLLSPKRQAT
jgi:hypothetical protein